MRYCALIPGCSRCPLITMLWFDKSACDAREELDFNGESGVDEAAEETESSESVDSKDATEPDEKVFFFSISRNRGAAEIDMMMMVREEGCDVCARKGSISNRSRCLRKCSVLAG